MDNSTEIDIEEKIPEELGEDLLKTESIQIAPTDDSNPIGQELDNPMLFVQLGDRVVIDSTKYGRTIGTVYYRSLERISIKPDGVSNTLHDFELEESDEEELYKEEDGVTAVYVIEKRKFESFVEQQDFRVNQMIDTFDSSGDLYKSYKIIKVDKDKDSIQIDDHELHFNYVGIESDEDIKVISIRQLVTESLDTESLITESLDVESLDVESLDVESFEEEEVKVIGFIEIIRSKVYEEAAYFEQRIPDNIQKIDALNDFLSSIDSSIQKDPKMLREKRVLIETLYNLKQETIAYNDDGTVRGQKDISASTLSELINKVSVPLGRPVLNIKKKIYIVENEILNKEINDDIYIENFIDEQNTLIQNKSAIVSSSMTGALGGKIVKEWNDQQTFLKKYLSPWLPNNTEEPLWRAISDSDFFRTSPPELDNVLLDTIQGYIPTNNNELPVLLDRIPFGLERGLEVSYRKGVDRKKQILLPEDCATMNSYLLFPIKTAIYLGRIRSSSVAIDSGRSQMTKKTMKEILQQIGGPTDIGTSNDLVLLDVNGTTLGNIPLADYIEGMSVPALGIGDTFETLDQYGMDSLELTPDIVNVLVNKIVLYQSQLLTTLSKMREMIRSEIKEPESNPFIETTILEELRTQPILADDINEYERINPSLISSDIGIVSYLMNKNPDYFQVTAGKNSLLISKALGTANKHRYMNSLAINRLDKYNKLNSGDSPIPNRCRHTRDLVSVRRIYDDIERFQKLTDFFRKYQGERDDNWINCNVCREHLLCIHERLQLHEFLNPNEKDSIHKEIILKCSGGQFQGKYICRNCGQAIRDIDFDNNIEFDDNGKPKSGNAVIENIDISDNLNVSLSSELKLNEDQEKCYVIIREIAEHVGVTLDVNGFNRVIDRTTNWVNRFLKRNDYNEKKKKQPTLPDYDIAIARNIITASATFLLLEIQTKIPSYIVRHSLVGCASPGFAGYPLDEDKNKLQGINYIACAVASIRRNEAPWNQTGFQKVKDDMIRQKGITVYMDNIIKQIISNDIIQSDINMKRKYYAERSDIFIQKDVICPTFLPEQLIINQEEAAKDVITPEVVANMGNKGKLSLVKLWIRKGHLLAKQTASLLRGSPHIETSCCLTNIEEPGIFWNNVELPNLDKRTLIPNQQGHFLITTFVPRPSISLSVEPDKELYYRIFLKCCFEGPRKGHSHEPGLTNACSWCGFQFPTIPSIMDTDTEGKGALISQNVNTNTDEFINLLDVIHDVNKVIPNKMIEQSQNIMDEFSLLTPPPISGWNEIILETNKQFISLPHDADKGDIALAAGPISEATGYAEKIINERITSEVYKNILEEIVTLSWINFFQVIQSYFITPFQRLLTQFNSNSLFIPVELLNDLSIMHVQDISPILDNEMSILIQKGDALKNPKFNLAKSKIRYFISQMSAILVYKNKIRPIIVPGRDITLVYIQRILLYGPLSTLINPSDIPVATMQYNMQDIQFTNPVTSIGDTSMKYLLELVALTLHKFNKERLTFSDQEIKEKLAIRDEKEKANIIAQYSKLTDEERAVELMNQRLGLGKYAVGGTKVIYSYDKEYYDIERQKRVDAGITEIPGSEIQEEGYEHNQHADDDYE